MSDALKVALLGCGTVGSSVLRLLSEQADDLAARIGRRVEVAGVAVRRPDRHSDVPADLLTTDAEALVTRDDVDLVVEVIGGIEPARTLLQAAIGAGKSVVSANKALLAEDGVALHARPPRPASTCTTRPPWPGRSRCCGRCASRSPGTSCAGSWAS